MPQHRHILITEPGVARNYTRPPSGGGGDFAIPPRDRRTHARKLIGEIDKAKEDAAAVAEGTGHVIHDLCLEIVGEHDYDLKVESLEDSRLGIQVQSVKRRDNTLHATIYVPEGKLQNFVRKIERYSNKDTKPSKKFPEGRPKNQELVAGISDIRFPVLRSFWTDDDDLYPATDAEAIWWEVWFRIGPDENTDEVFASVVAEMANTDLQLSQNVIHFPERLVFLAFGSPEQWTRVFVPFLDRIAEFRRAKEVPTEFLRLEAPDQREFLENLATRLILPRADAPAVCLLDYGVHTAHPLIRSLIADEDAQAFDPTWPIVDHADNHGTEMAGLLIFGQDLATLLANNANHPVLHRLESVRMLHSGRPHHRDVWGYVTQASLALAETQAPDRKRVACLAVTARDQGRDRGRPTSWSAAIDQHAAGQLDEQNVRRL